ncbi:ketopantoate reductase family protein [Promethearchaeum syntrophicum]|uniref:Ketopantoate reductase family protein n=1 Tax=Promethearchaeum syntrophicum TaxID=2594042 RepID=A0A5B9DA63_9ARCH|nr:2-dehydropantoate 2-reductase N-terminal domain-containing protein [Candidatus Prometheoarchaeum syntrophicum]QEE16158.1 2-dehydropantoate 2-reductase [Candidatus Prometheoarchaeum syntrophicum]
MRILFYGAGVIGSLYASELFSYKDNIKECINGEENNSQITDKTQVEINILARGKRLEDIQKNGIVINHYLQKKKTIINVPAIESLEENDVYDFIFVIMRKNQVLDILPILQRNKSENIIFLGNNGTGIENYQDLIRKERILLGFPSAGGRREGPMIKSIHSEKGNMTLGEMNGKITPRLLLLKKIFEAAKFPVVFTDNIDAWLKYHIALVSPLANGIFYAKGDNYKLAKDRNGIKLVIRAIKEGFCVLKNLNIPIYPDNLKKLFRYPRFLQIFFLKKALGSEKGELALRDHAMAAIDEMRQIADEFQEIIKKTSTPTPSINKLYEFIPLK